MVKHIGIISGAGPMAGVKLQELLIQKQQATAWEDHQFIQTTTIQFPFVGTSQCGSVEDDIVLAQLMHCANKLLHCGASHIVMACNSFYKFESFLLQQKIPVGNYTTWAAHYIAKHVKDNVLMLMSASSHGSALYMQQLQTLGINPVVYPEQEYIDNLIMNVMKGKDVCEALQTIQSTYDMPVFLGCTELCLSSSLVYPHYINSLDLMAQYILECV